MNDNAKNLWQVLGLGAVAGLRSMAAPAIASQILANHPSSELADSPLRFLQSPLTATISKLLTVGEMAGDKMPGIPNRIAPPALIGRVASGALVGAAFCKAKRSNVLAGVVLGSLAAVAGSYGGYYLRKGLGKWSGIADPIVGVLEDALVVASGVGLLEANKQPVISDASAQ
jgi:uncharacterized membrane protein